MTFYEIEFPLAGLSAERVEEVLLEIGARSITFLDRGDDPVLEPKPGEIRLWSDTLVRALFDELHDAARTLAVLATALGSHITASARIRAVEDCAWERVWLKDWKPMRFGERLWICPTFANAPPAPNSVVVWLDPGLAFGTGTHPTTALCLEVLDSLQLCGRSVIDYGCGSGILAIAALKLGAAHALGVDLDPQARLATHDNAVRNGVAARLDIQDVGAALPAADCVLANILAGPLIELAQVLTTACKPGGDLVLSGILSAQESAVMDCYAPRFDAVCSKQRDEWCCIHARGAY
jgi:ribosomal protein L11 methyltransferase